MEIKIKFERDKILKLAQNKLKDMNEAIAETIEETSGTEEILEGYANSELNVKSGKLWGSFKTEKTKDKLKVFSDIVYSRIQDMGGWAGRNHASYIPPTNYFKEGTKILKKSFYQNLRKKIKEQLEKNSGSK